MLVGYMRVSVGAALIAARDGKQDAYGAIATVIPWERFRATVAEAEALARPEEFDTLEKLGEHYAGIRRWSPAFLDAFDFEGVPACASLIRAIMVLREVNRSGVAPAEIRADRFCAAAMGALRPAGGWRHRSAALRALRAVGTARSAARRRRLGHPEAGNIDPSRSG